MGLTVIEEADRGFFRKPMPDDDIEATIAIEISGSTGHGVTIFRGQRLG